MGAIGQPRRIIEAPIPWEEPAPPPAQPDETPATTPAPKEPVPA